MQTLSIKFISCFLLVWLPLFPLSVIAQDTFDTEDSQDDFGGDPFDGLESNVDDLQWDVPEEQIETPAPSVETPAVRPESSLPAQKSAEPKLNSEPPEDYSTSSHGDTQESSFQNAIIEGVQLTSEKGDAVGETVITGYFIFRDKPSSYFYEVKLREKKLVFEFNDTKTGASPVPSASELPIKGFKIEEGKIDVNKEVRGLKPEWHDIIKVIFDLEQVPEVHVTDEFSIISFSFKWTSDPEKLSQYVVKDNTSKVILWSSAGVGGVGLGALAWFLLKQDPPPPQLGPLPIDDLPEHVK